MHRCVEYDEVEGFRSYEEEMKWSLLLSIYAALSRDRISRAECCSHGTLGLETNDMRRIVDEIISRRYRDVFEVLSTIVKILDSLDVVRDWRRRFEVFLSESEISINVML